MQAFEGLNKTKKQRVNFLSLPDCLSWDIGLLLLDWNVHLRIS